MAVYKRYKGNRVTRKDPNYNKGTWVAEGAIDGVRYHKSLKTAKTKDDAQTAEDLLIAQIHHGELEFLKDKTHFTDYVDNVYLPNAYLHNPSYKQKVTETNNLKKFFRDGYLKTITPANIESYKKKRLSEKVHCQRCAHELHTLLECKSPTVSPSTVNRELTTLSAIMSLAKTHRKIQENPCQSVKKLPEPEPRERYLTQVEKLRLLEVLQDKKQLLAIVLIALFTGWRRGQILSLRKMSLNYENQAVTLIRSKQQKQRTVPVAARTWLILTSIAKDKEDFLFTHHRTGERLKTFSKSWYSALDDAGIKEFRFHDLRHTFATELLSIGATEKMIQTSLGHSNVKTTQIYSHVLDDNLRTVLEVLTNNVKQDTIFVSSENN